MRRDFYRSLEFGVHVPSRGECLQGRTAGSFPEQRLAIENTNTYFAQNSETNSYMYLNFSSISSYDITNFTLKMKTNLNKPDQI